MIAISKMSSYKAELIICEKDMDKSLRCMTGEVLLVSHYDVLDRDRKRRPFVLCKVFDHKAGIKRAVDITKSTKFVGALPDNLAFASLVEGMSVNLWCRVDDEGNVNPTAELASPNYR